MRCPKMRRSRVGANASTAISNRSTCATALRPSQTITYAATMAITDTLKDSLLKVTNALHRSVLTISGGRLGKTFGKMQVVKLTTTGRTSGQPRTVILTTPLHEDKRFILVASKLGDDRDPDWYRNLVSNPGITLEPAGGSGPIALTARTATDAEKAELWPKIVAAYKGYDGYKEKTDRDIPVVICEPTT
jgi:deazaflavin-dependent oxidoreductase (nitroreductase family)